MHEKAVPLVRELEIIWQNRWIALVWYYWGHERAYSVAVPNEEKMSNLNLTSQSTCPHWGEGDSIFFNHFQSMDILGKIIYRSVSVSKISSIICR